jgi:lysophospholipase L1-like esterase
MHRSSVEGGLHALGLARAICQGNGGVTVQRMRIVFLGDSVTAGFGLNPLAGEASFLELLRARLADQPSPPELLASAWDGVDTAYARKRFDRMVTALDPDWVVILLGLNDAQPSGARLPTSPDEYRANLLALVDRILSLSARPVLVAPNPRFRSNVDQLTANNAATEEIMGPYVAQLRRVAEEGDFPWVDLHAPFLALPSVGEVIPDRVHPNAAGHALIANMLAAQLPCLWAEPQQSASHDSKPGHSADDFVPSEEAPIGWCSGNGRAATA